jgi:hypothetical protein
VHDGPKLKKEIACEQAPAGAAQLNAFVRVCLQAISRE